MKYSNCLTDYVKAGFNKIGVPGGTINQLCTPWGIMPLSGIQRVTGIAFLFRNSFSNKTIGSCKFIFGSLRIAIEKFHCEG